MGTPRIDDTKEMSNKKKRKRSLNKKQILIKSDSPSIKELNKKMSKDQVHSNRHMQNGMGKSTPNNKQKKITTSSTKITKGIMNTSSVKRKEDSSSSSSESDSGEEEAMPTAPSLMDSNSESDSDDESNGTANTAKPSVGLNLDDSESEYDSSEEENTITRKVGKVVKSESEDRESGTDEEKEMGLKSESDDSDEPDEEMEKASTSESEDSSGPDEKMETAMKSESDSDVDVDGEMESTESDSEDSEQDESDDSDDGLFKRKGEPSPNAPKAKKFKAGSAEEKQKLNHELMISAIKDKGAFENFTISEDTIIALKADRVQYLFPIQAKTFKFVYSGNDVIAKAETGTGKMLAFVLPLVERLQGRPRTKGSPPAVLAILPTQELATEVFDCFKKFGRGLRCHCVYGETPIDPQLSKLRKGLDVLVGTVDRIKVLVEKEALDLTKLEILVLDEVNHIVDMDDSEDIENIFKQCYNREEEANPQTLLFSAILPKWVMKIADKYMDKDYQLVELDENEEIVKPPQPPDLCKNCLVQFEASIDAIPKSTLELVSGQVQNLIAKRGAAELAIAAISKLICCDEFTSLPPSLTTARNQSIDNDDKHFTPLKESLDFSGGLGQVGRDGGRREGGRGGGRGRGARGRGRGTGRGRGGRGGSSGDRGGRGRGCGGRGRGSPGRGRGDGKADRSFQKKGHTFFGEGGNEKTE